MPLEPIDLGEEKDRCVRALATLADAHLLCFGNPTLDRLWRVASDLAGALASLVVRVEDQAADAGEPGRDALVGRPLEEVELYYTDRALELAGGNREAAASMLGIGERTLYRKLAERPGEPGEHKEKTWDS